MILIRLLFICILLAANNISIAQTHSHASIELIYVIQPNGNKIHYAIYQDSISITSLSKLETGDSILYRSALTNHQVISYYNKINALKIDTLEQYYDGGGFDGFDLFIRYNNNLGKEHSIGLHNFKHPVIAMLIDETNKLIVDPKLKLTL